MPPVSYTPQALDTTAAAAAGGTINGDAGNDVINGTAATVAFKAFGGDGTDTITGGAGNDEIRGNVGDDSLIGGAGQDSIYGGEGNDTINSVGTGYFNIEAGTGNDTVYADNTGGKATWVVAAANTQVSNLQSAANALGRSFLYKGKATVTFAAGNESGAYSVYLLESG